MATPGNDGPPPAPRRAAARGFAQALPVAIVGAVLIGYFVWLCSEMGTHVHLGIDMLAGTFGAIGLGILAALVPLALRAAARARRAPSAAAASEPATLEPGTLEPATVEPATGRATDMAPAAGARRPATGTGRRVSPPGRAPARPRRPARPSERSAPHR